MKDQHPVSWLLQKGSRIYEAMNVWLEEVLGEPMPKPTDVIMPDWGWFKKKSFEMLELSGSGEVLTVLFLWAFLLCQADSIQSVIHVPILCFKATLPSDGLPMLGDWVATAESIWSIGYEGFREAVEFQALEFKLVGGPMDFASLMVSKGCGRVSVLLFSLVYTYLKLKDMMTPEEFDDMKQLLGA